MYQSLADQECERRDVGVGQKLDKLFDRGDVVVAVAVSVVVGGRLRKILLRLDKQRRKQHLIETASLLLKQISLWTDNKIR